MLGAMVFAPPLAGQIPTGSELLIDVHIERGPSGLALARGTDNGLLLALGQILDLAELRVVRVVEDSLVEALLEPAGIPLEMNTVTGEARRGDERWPIAAGAAFWDSGLLFVATDEIARLLDVGIGVNVAELTVTIRRAAQLPAVQRAERERRHAQLRNQQPADLPSTERLAVRPALVDGAVLDWSAALGTLAPAGPGGLQAESGTLQLGLGVGLFGGSGILIHQERWLSGPSPNNRRTDASWTRVWPTNPRLRQLRVGEVSGTGRQPRPIQGIALTNSPFVRPVTFATGSLTGVLPPGWEVELYRHGSLVGLTTTDDDGTYAFDVPLVYGTNPVELVGYGPTGEVRRFQRTFEVPFERLVAGAFEYGVAGGACDQAPCQATGNVDLRYGATSQLTVRAGWDQFWRDTLPDLWHPYASATFQATRALAMFGEVVGNAQFGGLVSYAPSPNLQGGFGHTHYVADSVIAPLVGTTVLDDLTSVHLFLRPGVLRGRFYVRADGRRAYGALLRSYDARLTATAQIPSTRLDAGIRVSRVSPRQTPFVTTTLLSAAVQYQTGPAFGPLRHTIGRAGVEVDPTVGIDRVVAGISRALWHDYYLDMSVRWTRGNEVVDDMVTANITFKATLPSVRFASQNRFDDFGAVGLQTAEGTLLYDRGAGRVAFSDGRGIGRSGVSGIVFIDQNGNGRFDLGEPPVPGARIRVGPWVAEADESGRYTVWDVVPFEQLVIQVDPNSARDPLWVPAVLRYVLNPDPNRFASVDIPFVQTSEVVGELRLQPTGAPLPSTEVMLIPDDGSEPYRVVTFADGGFYAMNVRPGRYRATLSPEVQNAYGVVSEDAVFTVEAGGSGVVEGVVVNVWKVAGPGR